MTQATSSSAPYAPARNVIEVIQRMRDRGLPDPIDLGALATIGIPEGNAPRTLAALKFLGLVAGDNRRTDAFDRLGRASSADYPELLAELVREAYAPVFQIVDPAQDADDKVFDAFRQYEPASQLQRMVTLFMSLCAEAQVVPRDKVQQRRTAPGKALGRPPKQLATRHVSGKSRSQAVPDSAREGPDFRAIHAWVDQLPASGYWTAEKRDRWLAALKGLVDYAVEVRKTTNDNGFPAMQQEEVEAERVKAEHR